MKLAVCIQAQDTGRILFVREEFNGVPRWSWPETRLHFDWLTAGGLSGAQARICRAIDIADLNFEWFNARGALNVLYIRMPEERPVHCPKENTQWCSLFGFPETLHPFIVRATSDLLFLNSLVTAETECVAGL